MYSIVLFWSIFDRLVFYLFFFFFFQAEDGIRDHCVTGVQTCALPISPSGGSGSQACRSRAACPPRASRASSDRKSTRLNSSHTVISYAVFCLKKKKKYTPHRSRQN